MIKYLLLLIISIVISSKSYSQPTQDIFENQRAKFKNQYLTAKNDIKRSQAFNSANEWSKIFLNITSVQVSSGMVRLFQSELIKVVTK